MNNVGWERQRVIGKLYLERERERGPSTIYLISTHIYLHYLEQWHNNLWHLINAQWHFENTILNQLVELLQWHSLAPATAPASSSAQIWPQGGGSWNGMELELLCCKRVNMWRIYFLIYLAFIGYFHFLVINLNIVVAWFFTEVVFCLHFFNIY